MDKIDLRAFYLSGTYCHKTGILHPLAVKLFDNRLYILQLQLSKARYFCPLYRTDNEADVVMELKISRINKFI